MPPEATTLTLIAVPGIPAIGPGDDFAAILAAALDAAALAPRDGDVLVVSHKVLSKAEDRYLDLATVTPSPRALELAAQTGKDARLVQAILDESREVLRHRPGLVIAEHRCGMVMANAGIDRSNLDGAAGADCVLRLPVDADASAAVLREALGSRYGVRVAVVVADSVGRAWRNGIVGTAIGAAGLPALLDLRGRPDRTGRPLEVTLVGFADEIAAAAELLMGEADEGRPVVLVRGLSWSGPDAPAASLVRRPADDLFR